MNRIRASIIFSTIVLLAGSAFAWQYSGGSQAQTPQPQGSMQQGQTSPSVQTSPNQGAMQPGQSSQQPGQAGQQAQPGDQSQQGPPQAGQAPSIDDQVQVLAQQLNLSADQQAKVKTVLQDQHAQAMTIIHDSSLQREDKIQKIHALRESTISKVRGTLSGDDQKQKFDQMVQAQNDRMQGGQGQPSQAPPKQ